MAHGMIAAESDFSQPETCGELAMCRVCHRSRPHDDFYVRQLRKCGTVGECKECTKSRVRERARTDPKVQEYDRMRAKEPHRKANSARITKEWRENNPEGYKAHTALNNAIRSGRVKKEPCLFCGATHVHAHHRDYGQPLQVIWLCPKCHHRLHANFPETEGANKSRSEQAVRR